MPVYAVNVACRMSVTFLVIHDFNELLNPAGKSLY